MKQVLIIGLAALAAACTKSGAGADAPAAPVTYPQMAEPNPVLPQGPPAVQRYAAPQPKFADPGDAERTLASGLLRRDTHINRECVNYNEGDGVRGVARLDLNGDGAPELWIQAPPCHFGETTPSIFLYTADGRGGWRVLAEPSGARDGYAVLATRTQGWSDLGAWISGMAEVTTWEYRFDGTRYAMAACRVAPLTEMGAPNRLKVGPWKPCPA